jgi:hypothetical protein
MNLKTLKAIKNVFGRNSTKLPVLDCFYIDSQFLYFTHLDLSIRVKHFFPFKEGSPAIVIDANNFIARSATIKAPYLINSDVEQKITFISPDSITKMTGFVPADYPIDFINKEYKDLFTLSGSEIRLMNIAKEFTANDDLRPIMNMVCISKDHIVSSDAHKLYYRKIGKKSDIDVLIPQRTIQLMMLAGGASFVISCQGSYFKAESDDMTIYWRSDQSITNNLVDSGKYPNWQSVLPKTDKQVIIPVNEFITAIRSVAFALNGASRLLRCEIKEGFLVIEGKDHDFDMYASEKISIINAGNIAMRFGIKADFIKEILKMFKDEGRPQITMGFTDNTHAFIFADAMLLMPMILNDEY